MEENTTTQLESELKVVPKEETPTAPAAEIKLESQPTPTPEPGTPVQNLKFMILGKEVEIPQRK